MIHDTCQRVRESREPERNKGAGHASTRKAWLPRMPCMLLSNKDTSLSGAGKGRR